jgi:hypothetical protein
MTFNLKKAQVINNSVTPQSAAVPSHSKKYNLSLEGSGIKSINGLLEVDRRSLGESPETHEGLLNEARRKASVSEKITEGAIEDANSPLYPHRQFKGGEDNYVVSPIDALAHANDRKFRDAFSKANKGSDTSFWDKFVGAQLDGEPTKVMLNLPEKGSQLQNSPHRFGNLDGLPHDPDAATNRERFGKEPDIKPMNKKEKPIEITASLKSADKLLFGIYLKANREGRDLTASEKEIVSAINNDKVNILMSLAQTEDPLSADPNNPPFEPNVSPAPEPSVNPQDREADFMDGNPTVSGDEHYWATQSGFSPPVDDMADPNAAVDPNASIDPNDDSGFDFPEPMSGISGVTSRDVSYTGGIGQTTPSEPESPVDNAIGLPNPQEDTVDDAPF